MANLDLENGKHKPRRAIDQKRERVREAHKHSNQPEQQSKGLGESRPKNLFVTILNGSQGDMHSHFREAPPQAKIALKWMELRAALLYWSIQLWRAAPRGSKRVTEVWFLPGNWGRYRCKGTQPGTRSYLRMGHFLELFQEDLRANHST